MVILSNYGRPMKWTLCHKANKALTHTMLPIIYVLSHQRPSTHHGRVSKARSSVFQIIVFCLIGAKSLSEQILAYFHWILGNAFQLKHSKKKTDENKNHVNMSSARWRLFCIGLNALTWQLYGAFLYSKKHRGERSCFKDWIVYITEQHLFALWWAVNMPRNGSQIVT